MKLFMCDTCVRSFCVECVDRNFGTAEAEYVGKLEVWSCYVCTPTAKLKSIQIHDEVSYFNIDKAYASVRPPDIKEVLDRQASLTCALSPEERKFASIFTSCIGSITIQDSEIIAKYLTAIDLSVVVRVSSGLRKLFQSQLFFIPGLFKTEYGQEHLCKLHNHQLVSLHRMMQIENRTREFGDLRGGIFGDEPGLGKTVTALALIAATAGQRPLQPAVFWNKETILVDWQEMRGQYDKLLGPVLNRLQKSPEMGRYITDSLLDLRRNVNQYCGTIETFEEAGERASERGGWKEG